jgi:pyruvate dehydrogenase (quinone)
LAHDGPALLDVQVNRMEFVMPAKVLAEHVFSTSLFGMKAIRNGRSDEAVRLLKDNFWR